MPMFKNCLVLIFMFILSLKKYWYLHALLKLRTAEEIEFRSLRVGTLTPELFASANR